LTKGRVAQGVFHPKIKINLLYHPLHLDELALLAMHLFIHYKNLHYRIFISASYALYLHDWRTLPYSQPLNTAGVHGWSKDALYTLVYYIAPVHGPCTTGVHGPCTRAVYNRCTWAVYGHGCSEHTTRVHGPWKLPVFTGGQKMPCTPVNTAIVHGPCSRVLGTP